MYLSKIELSGFKSFAQRTVLQFDPGITAIVGPNGCGKSNIVDAVRWVIGEQRARILRSEKMENVIFNGTSKRKPLGMGEVLLTIENNRGVLPTEYSEVTLGRRLFRSGDSEYLLNDTRCRLQDITDLFMDTGMGAGAYSVIELKMIDEILSENAQDRRHLFEEAAGITRYKVRRRQALSKLDSTQADLTRLRDLTEEIEKQVRSLKRQAEKASRYKDYEERLRRLELTLAQLEYERLTGQIESLESDVDLLRKQIESLSDQQEAEESRLDAFREQLSEREKELSVRRQELNEHLDAVRRIETDLRLSQERLEGARRDQQRIRQEQKDATQQRDNLVQSLSRLDREVHDAQPVLQEADRVLGEARVRRDELRTRADAQRKEVEERRTAVQKAESQRNETQRTLDRLISRVELLERDRERISSQLQSAGSQQTELFSRHDAASTDLTSVAERVDSERRALDEVRARASQLQEEVDDARETLRQAERARDAAAAEVALLDSLVASYEDFSGAVQYLATNHAWSAHELTTVSDLISCHDDDRAAVEAALGPYGSCVVVQSEAEVEQAVSLLRSDEKGRATFIVLDRLQNAGDTHPSPKEHEDANVQALLERVRIADEKYRKLADLLLGNCYLVEALDQARAFARSNVPARYFTASGEWVDARGLVHGGSGEGGVSALANRLGRRDQLDSARSTLSGLEIELERQQRRLEELLENLSGLPVQEQASRTRAAERELAEAEKVAARVALEVESHDRRQVEMSERCTAIDAELESDRAAIVDLEVRLAEADDALQKKQAERAEVEAAFARTEALAREAIQSFSDANVSAVQARNYVENLQRDVERTGRDIAHLDARTEQHEGELSALDDAIEETERKCVALAQAFDSTHDERTRRGARVEEAEKALVEIKAAISDVESRLRVIRQQRDQSVRDEGQRAVRLAEVTTRRADLLEHILEDFGVSLPEEPIAIEDEFDAAPARQEVQELRERIRALGAVNALALESYEEEAERLAFLTEQRDDLEQAEKTLLDTIREINTTAAARFYETFEAINENFSRIFGDLFVQDATAYLELADPSDPLESPIEIIAKPRGKRPSGIAQLSGGEKTLTAIALLFAIYLVKPSPFCILDEVDAPLDDANVDRFMMLIRQFASSTQFILVTHNKRTMELADRMYGVTMQEQGVSKLVGVKFDEAVEMVS